MAIRSAVRRRVSFADRDTAVFTLVLVLALVTALPGGAWPQSKFVNEVADGSANYTGQYTSLALDAQGNPHVSYYDFTTGDLKYARKSGGVWTTETADGSANIVGVWTSIALDAQGNPHVSHQDYTTRDLKYARRSGGVWTNETADGSANDVGGYTSLALDAQGNPHVSYQDATTFDLKYARKSGGVWTTETADGNFVGGAYTSLALDAQGNPHVSYPGAATFDLKYARKSGGVWTTETADASTFAGNWISLALDAQGNPHVSYQIATSYDLKYARKSGGVWTTETADGSAHDQGHFTSLALDAQGNPHVSYYDDTTNELKYARKSGGVWTTESADASANDVGWYTSLALDAQGNAHMSYHDATTGDLKYATAAVRLASPSAGVTWAVGSSQEIRWSGVGPVSILLSPDGGGTYLTLLEATEASPLAIRVPHTPSRFARIKILRESPLSIAFSDSFFKIDATIALLKFDATAPDGGSGVALSWKTEPGPEADVRYRVERASADPSMSGEFAPIHAGLLDGGEYVDRSPGASARYRLIAVNGLGEEYALGETIIAPALSDGRSLAVSPSVARGGGIEVAFRVASDLLASDVSIFGASGRLVRRLASGSFPTGVRSVTWDGRDDRGVAASAGVYFVRLAWGGQGRETQRVTLVH